MAQGCAACSIREQFPAGRTVKAESWGRMRGFLAKLTFCGVFTAWLLATGQGHQAWYMTAGNWTFGALGLVLALGMALAMLGWFNALLNAVARMPETLERLSRREE